MLAVEEVDQSWRQVYQIGFCHPLLRPMILAVNTLLEVVEGERVKLIGTNVCV